MSRQVSAGAAEEEHRVLGPEPVLAPVHRSCGEHPGQAYDLGAAKDPDAPLVILRHGDHTAVHPVAELVILPETGHHTPIEPGAQASTR
ncbi:hypothetical protein [Streptomyces canus]|uniref:hypothetical protein n=1 Tax=Streptomyces canus TaxID=58343 RepID=UPI00386E502F|nr:hypothetical protein OH824_37375 [Streptomyces canus]